MTRRKPQPETPTFTGESGLLAGQTDPAMRALLRAQSAGLRARYGTLRDRP